MITPSQEDYLLTHAYVPEHIVSLMVLISKGEPFLVGDHLCYVKDNWLIFVGYPLGQDSFPERIETMLKGVIERFRPNYVWFIGQQVPSLLNQDCKERESDHYYKLHLGSLEIKKDLMRLVQRARKDSSAERSHILSEVHEELIHEFIKREKPNPMIKALFLSMPEYVNRSQSAIVLNAWDAKGHLSGFYIADLGAKSFATYVVGCYSKKNYVPQTSDLLFFEMIELSKEHGKETINLGLGVNEGISRFKKKWGGVPFLRYEFCEYETGYTRTMALVKSLEGKL